MEIDTCSDFAIADFGFILQVLGKKIHERYMTAQEVFGDLNDNVLRLWRV